MKFRNPFRKSPATVIRSTSAEELQLYAGAFVQTILDDANEEQARVIELAVKNGTVTVSIEITPTPSIRVSLDPGSPVSFCINQA